MKRNLITLSTIILVCVISLSIARFYSQLHKPVSAKDTNDKDKPNVITHEEEQYVTAMSKMIGKSKFVDKVTKELKANGYRSTGAAAIEIGVDKKLITIMIKKDQKISDQEKEEISHIVNNEAIKNKLGSFIVKTQYVD
ncbi:hypothetical protein [Terrilactibacillus laevilacticus]|uniref:Stage III sporulation protein AH n=1 Tax=Terrilactibacillus laevilacticus TaxID=1380157 RepID=A0ABW5PSJ2_9BACI|nr:hypothetical protein [Terrilactibacillus laevilacticus]